MIQKRIKQKYRIFLNENKETLHRTSIREEYKNPLFSKTYFDKTISNEFQELNKVLQKVFKKHYLKLQKPPEKLYKEYTNTQQQNPSKKTEPKLLKLSEKLKKQLKKKLIISLSSKQKLTLKLDNKCRT